MDKKLNVIDVSYGTTHDGPGMRTTIFVKGCSLRCKWCQNPESIRMTNEPWWDQTKCIGCRSCEEACPTGAVKAGEKGYQIDRMVCKNCGACAEACPAGAMTQVAEAYDLETLMRDLLKYRTYYDQFGGGVTCSGGEPLMQYEFIRALFKSLHDEGITTALDTCGFAPRENLEAVLPFTDYILYDMKLFDGKKHAAFTGHSNEKILDNLLYAANYARTADHPMEIWIRTPLIPGATADAENIRAIGTFLRENVADVVTRWELCAFNGACILKYNKLGAEWMFKDVKQMTQSEVDVLRTVAEERFGKEKILVTGMIRPDSEQN